MLPSAVLKLNSVLVNELLQLRLQLCLLAGFFFLVSELNHITHSSSRGGVKRKRVTLSFVRSTLELTGTTGRLNQRVKGAHRTQADAFISDRVGSSDRAVRSTTNVRWPFM